MPVDSPRYRPASPHAYTAPLPAWPAIRGAGVGAEVATNLMAAFVGMGDTAWVSCATGRRSRRGAGGQAAAQTQTQYLVERRDTAAAIESCKLQALVCFGVDPALVA